MWFGPYGFNTEMLIWLSALALYPISLFIWSYFHIRLIEKKIKFSFISAINTQVNIYFSLSIKNRNYESIDKLSTLMNIQSKLYNLKRYKFDMGGIITLISTSMVTIGQILLVIKRIISYN